VLGEILDVVVAQHRRLAEIVDDDADELHSIANHCRLGSAGVEYAAGNRLRQSFGRHRVVLTVVDNAEPRPEQQCDKPLRRGRQRSNNAAK